MGLVVMMPLLDTALGTGGCVSTALASCTGVTVEAEGVTLSAASLPRVW